MPETKVYTPQDILSLSVELEDGSKLTVGSLLAQISYDILIMGEGFDPKYPVLGNPNWREDVAHAAILEGYIYGELDNSGSVTDYDRRQLNTALEAAFGLLKQADYSTLSLPPEPKEYFLIAFDSDGEMSGYIEFPHTKEDAEKQLKTLEEGYPAGYWRIVHIPK